MARMHTTPRFPLGTRVLKRFPGYADPFGGEVDAFVADSGFYHVRYDDGDSEEMTEDDVERHYHSEPPKRREKKHKPAAKPTVAKPKDQPRAKVLLLSASEPSDGGLADGEEEEQEEQEEEEEEEEKKVVTSTDEVHRLVGQRVCKRQTDGVVSGSVSTYFPATKMYRVVYSNGTTDDMTYRQVVDSIPLSVASATTAAAMAKTNKRKPTGEASPRTPTSTNGDKGASGSQSPKKRKLDEKPKTKTTAVDENASNENASKASDDQSGAKRPNGVDVADAAMVMPSMKEESFVWNRKAAYDMVRAVLYVVASTGNEASEGFQVLNEKSLKAKAALVAFVERGGLTTLKERLILWCKAKETEAGVLAILKVLAVLPGVTKEMVMSSAIGKTLNDIRKRKEDLVCAQFDRIVQEMASYIINKWKKEFGENGDKGSQKNASKTKPKNGAGTSKPLKASTSSTKAETSSSGSASTVSHKRSNSVGHLRDLIGGGSRMSQTRSGDLLGNSLNHGRPGSRPQTGAAHTRVGARRSTVLLDSIKNRIEARGSERSTPTSGNGNSLQPDVWTASRVKFGGHSTLEFDKEIEVSLLLIAPTPGAIRPFRPKSALAKTPSTDKQPAKSILRVKLAASERAANAAMLEAEQNRNVMLATAAAERMSIGPIEGTSASQPSTTRPSIGDGTSLEVTSGAMDTTGDGDRDEEEAEVPLTAAPPSPPRKHDVSDDEGEDEERELPPMPNDIMIGQAPSPPSSDTTGEQSVDATAMDEVMDGDDQEDGTTAKQSLTTERVASPEVLPDSSPAESGEIDDEEELPSHPSSPSPRSSSPTLPPAPPPPPPPPSAETSLPTADAVESMEVDP